MLKKIAFQYPKPNYHEINFQIFKKLVDMRLGQEISFDYFLLYSHLN
jgi:hypothetical protein